MDFTAIDTIDQPLLRLFNDTHTPLLDSLSLLLTSGLTWIPLYVALTVLVVKNNETIPQVALVIGGALLSVLLSGGVDDMVVKPLVGRPRPALDPIIMYTVNVVDGHRGLGFSFFSAHAANTMALATFFIWLVRDRLISALLVAWSLVNCWTRLYMGVHYPSDIAVGLLWGVIAGTVAYMVFRRLYYKVTDRITYISSQYSSTGYSKSDIDIVAAVLVFTVAVAVLVATWQTSRF